MWSTDRTTFVALGLGKHGTTAKHSDLFVEEGGVPASKVKERLNKRALSVVNNPAGQNVEQVSAPWVGFEGMGEMAIAEDFAAAYAAVTDLARPELLPARLARACALVLPVAGVGISMFGAHGMRIPVGASDDTAAVAERLQFTAAEGPCLDAHQLARSVLATESLIAQRWPDFYTGLIERTPFRAVAAIPWPNTLKGAGTVDLLFHHSRDLIDLDFTVVDEIIVQVEHTLDSESVIEFSPSGPAPAWLAGPSANSRNGVFIAMGMLNVTLEVTAPDALALLRGHAYATSRTLDDVARDVVNRRIAAHDLRVGSNQ
jgi:hypothetical protein